MYHYVRDLSRSRYPGIKARTLSDFKGQLDYIAKHFTVVTVDEIITAITGGSPLPSNAAWLTFDDGYIDHYTNVFPLLNERGWQGSFFPPANTVLRGELLDVNKIHFILASQPNSKLLIDAIRLFLLNVHSAKLHKDFDSYWGELAHPDRFDTAEVVFIKRMLQRDLPESLRNELTDHLFHHFVKIDPVAFASEVYMSVDQLKTMIRAGMYVGSHGAKHYWLDRLSPQDQAADIDDSLNFLESLGAPTNNWIMCYPYGAYNDALVQFLTSRGCAIGLTTEVAPANLGSHHRLRLPRLDTNDFPTTADGQHKPILS